MPVEILEKTLDPGDKLHNFHNLLLEFYANLNIIQKMAIVFHVIQVI